MVVTGRRRDTTYQLLPDEPAELWTGWGLTTAAGYSNYNGLQIFNFRQKQWHGMQFDVNYTWSHTLGINSQNSWTGVFNQFSRATAPELWAVAVRHSKLVPCERHL